MGAKRCIVQRIVSIMAHTHHNIGGELEIMNSSKYVPERAMFIFAHPDDIEFGVAGTAATWAKKGCEVVYVVITDGNVGSHETGMTSKELAAIRRREQKEAADVVVQMEFRLLPLEDKDAYTGSIVNQVTGSEEFLGL